MSWADVEAAAPDVILLPDEPHAFGPADAQELLADRSPRAGGRAAAARLRRVVAGLWRHHPDAVRLEPSID